MFFRPKKGSSASKVVGKTELKMPWAECNAKLLEYNRDVDEAAVKEGFSHRQYCTFSPNGYYPRFSTMVGVISCGFGCDRKLPNVNTRVTYYLDWIGD